jgi:hypothetical protein
LGRPCGPGAHSRASREPASGYAAPSYIWGRTIRSLTADEHEHDREAAG